MILFARLIALKTTKATCSNLNSFRTLTTAMADHLSNGGGGGGGRRDGTNDDYFATIHHISNIVRRDIYLERTLNKMCISRIVNSELVYRVLRSCSNSGIESFRFFNWVRTQHPQYEPTTVEFEELLKILAKTRHWETMWKVAHQMKTQKLPISSSVVSFIIEHYGKNGLIDQAVELFNKCNNFNCTQTTEIYNSLLFALCEVKNFQGAYALVRRMVRKGKIPDKKTYSVLVNGWCTAGKMKEAQSFLEEMSQKGFNPPVRGRDLLIDGLLNAGYLESAKGLVRKMTKEGFVCDVSTFNTLALAICNSGEIDFCIGLYHDVCRLGLCPDIETYKIMITATSKIGRIDEAFSVLYRSIEDGNKPFPSLYAPVLKGLFRNGKFDDAFSFFSDMKAKGHPANRPVYSMILKMCVRGGRYVEAGNYLMEMIEFKLSPMSRHFDMVTDGLKNCGKHDMAERIQQLEISLRGDNFHIGSDDIGEQNRVPSIIAPIDSSYRLPHVALTVANEHNNIIVKVCVMWPNGFLVNGPHSRTKTSSLAPWENFVDVVEEVRPPLNSSSWWDICKMTPRGAILVRPDDHIVWRFLKSAVVGDDVRLEMERGFRAII